MFCVDSGALVGAEHVGDGRAGVPLTDGHGDLVRPVDEREGEVEAAQLLLDLRSQLLFSVMLKSEVTTRVGRGDILVTQPTNCYVESIADLFEDD